VLLLAVAVAATLGAGGLLVAGLGPQFPSLPGVGWLTGAVPAPSAAAESPGQPEQPVRLRIPAIGVDTGLAPLHLDGAGRLPAPRSYDEAGWYAEGTVPGQPGPAVIAGHVDSVRGRAVFYQLRRLRPGDTVEVQLRCRGESCPAGQPQTWVAFRVTAVREYAKSDFPTAAVYGPTPDPQLRLITCGGEFDRTARSYLDNVVVSAVPA
jgi:sortase (surface protein transpeptidase)